MPRLRPLPCMAGPGVCLGNRAPLYNADGKRVGAIESVRDITDRKLAEEQRNNDVALIESLLLNSPAGIRVFDSESGQCVLVNQSAADIAGGSREALLDQNFRRLESWKVSGLLPWQSRSCPTGNTKHGNITAHKFRQRSAGNVPVFKVHRP